MEQFLQKIREIMEEEFGESSVNNGAIRCMAEDLGRYEGKAIVEAMWVPFVQGAEYTHPVIQFASTLAQEIEDEVVADIKRSLTDLNVHTMLGQYGYYEPLRQLYHCYRMPVNLDVPEQSLEEVRYTLQQIRRQLDAYLDYVLVVAEQPNAMTVEEYIVATHAENILGEMIGILNV